MKTKKATKYSRPGDDGKTRRTRLSSEVRRRQILDAALVEFGRLGFAGTSISRIAQRVGISKANIYAHFASKDDIFETLLRSLTEVARTHGDWSRIRDGQDVAAFIDELIDATYASITPETLSIRRIMITEGHRVPDVLARWCEALAQNQAERQAAIDELVATGRMKRSPLTDHFKFAMSPFAYAVVAKMVFGDAVADELERMKETHRKLLHEMLVP